MKKLKVITNIYPQDFERNVNTFFEKIKNNSIVANYTCGVNNNVFRYVAFIEYEDLEDVTVKDSLNIDKYNLYNKLGTSGARIMKDNPEDYDITGGGR